MAMSPSEIMDLGRAKALLENPGIAVKLSNYVGAPIEGGLKRLPEPVVAVINTLAHKSLETACNFALLTMDKVERQPSSNRMHKLAVAATGAGGGAFGLPALALEIPVSTTIMLRSIADIARCEGEDLQHPEARLQCLQILAMGGNTKSDDSAETGYFAVRSTLAKAISEAAAHLAEKGLTQHGAPVLVKLIAQIASRFSIAVTEKVALQAVPLIGALGGAAINTVFMDHFQDMSRGHFILRRLERQHGLDEVRRLYEEI